MRQPLCSLLTAPIAYSMLYVSTCTQETMADRRIPPESTLPVGVVREPAVVLVYQKVRTGWPKQASIHRPTLEQTTATSRRGHGIPGEGRAMSMATKERDKNYFFRGRNLLAMRPFCGLESGQGVEIKACGEVDSRGFSSKRSLRSRSDIS